MFASALRGCFLGVTLILATPVPALPDPLPGASMLGAGELPQPDSVEDADQLTRMLEVAADEAYRLALSEKRPSDMFFWDPGTGDEQRVLDRIVAFRTRAEAAEQGTDAERSVPLARADPASSHESLRTFAPENIGDGRQDRRISGHEIEDLRDAGDDVSEALDLTSMPRTKRYWILRVKPILVRLEDLTAR